MRTALGANRSSVVGLIVREGLVLAAIGLSVGAVGGYFVRWGMQKTLYSMGELDLSVMLSVALLLFLSALLACLIPARRAASVQPMQALRTE